MVATEVAAYFRWLNRGRPAVDPWTDWFAGEAEVDSGGAASARRHWASHEGVSLNIASLAYHRWELRGRPTEPIGGLLADWSAAKAEAAQRRAVTWLDTERPSLVAAITMAASTGRDQTAMQLPLTLSPYLSRRQRFDDLLAITTISRDTAHRLGDRQAEAMALIYVGLALRGLARSEEAFTAHQDAAAISQETGDRYGQAMALNNLGFALRRVGWFDEAITPCQDAAARAGA